MYCTVTASLLNSKAKNPAKLVERTGKVKESGIKSYD